MKNKNCSETVSLGLFLRGIAFHTQMKETALSQNNSSLQTLNVREINQNGTK